MAPLKNNTSQLPEQVRSANTAAQPFMSESTEQKLKRIGQQILMQIKEYWDVFYLGFSLIKAKQNIIFLPSIMSHNVLFPLNLLLLYHVCQKHRNWTSLVKKELINRDVPIRAYFNGAVSKSLVANSSALLTTGARWQCGSAVAILD